MLITKNLGSYNVLNPRDKQWCVTMYFPDKTQLSEMWPEEDEPDIDGVPPSQVLDMLEDRLKCYLLTSRRDEKLARIAAYREQAEQLDDAWARRQIAHYERLVNGLRGYLLPAEEASA